MRLPTRPTEVAAAAAGEAGGGGRRPRQPQTTHSMRWPHDHTTSHTDSDPVRANCFALFFLVFLFGVADTLEWLGAETHLFVRDKRTGL